MNDQQQQQTEEAPALEDKIQEFQRVATDAATDCARVKKQAKRWRTAVQEWRGNIEDQLKEASNLSAGERLSLEAHKQSADVLMELIGEFSDTLIGTISDTAQASYYNLSFVRQWADNMVEPILSHPTLLRLVGEPEIPEDSILLPEDTTELTALLTEYRDLLHRQVASAPDAERPGLQQQSERVSRALARIEDISLELTSDDDDGDETTALAPANGQPQSPTTP